MDDNIIIDWIYHHLIGSWDLHFSFDLIKRSSSFRCNLVHILKGCDILFILERLLDLCWWIFYLGM
jgi:hypothetical protein